jgi:hypothetical protein
MLSSWLTNSALVYEPKYGGGGGDCVVSAHEYSCAHGAQIYFGDLTPYLNCVQGSYSANLCSLAYRYDNPILTRFLAPYRLF